MLNTFSEALRATLEYHQSANLAVGAIQKLVSPGAIFTCHTTILRIGLVLSNADSNFGLDMQKLQL